MDMKLRIGIACLLLLAGCAAKPGMQPRDLRCENLRDPLAIDTTQPRLSWKIPASEGFTQSAYEILVASDSLLLHSGKADLWSSGKVASAASVMVPYAGRALASPSLAYWKVRVWDGEGRPSAWSPVARFGVGILDRAGWPGQFIGMEGVGSPLLRKGFRVDGKKGTYLVHVNSLGYHEVWLNGEKVCDEVLSPAVSQLDKRSLAVTYDLTPHVRDGANDLVLWLGRGWYRPTTFGAAHDGPLVNVRLDEVTPGGCRTLLASDASWVGRDSGYADTQGTTWLPLQFGGECVDGAKVVRSLAADELDPLAWNAVGTVDIPEAEVSPRMCEPNRIRDTVQPASLAQVADGVWVADMGRTVNGWIELRMPPMEKGRKVRIEYADWLADDGTFRSQEGNTLFEDGYIAAGDGHEIFRNKFNHHAFRYIRISGIPAAPERLTAYLIQSDFADACTFACSDPDLNAIYGMVEYTFRNLAFGGYVVDCPHLERMGYGGDGNASCNTFQTFYDAAPLYMNWMQMWGDCVRADGGMPHNVPNPYPAGGGPYWCGFVITASWQTYVNYGDDLLLERYYPVMQRWLGYAGRYISDGLLRRWPDTDYRGWYLGDWLAPAGVDYTSQASVDLVSNCFLSDCYATMAKIAAHLGRADEAAQYRNSHEALNRRIQAEFFDPSTDSYATGSQIDQVYPMLVGVTGEGLAQAVTERLFRTTRDQMGGHIGCGLVGVTVLTEWAIRNGHADFVYSMLKKRDEPGYLHMLDRGATTTWESWNGERSKVHNCYNGIGAWFVQALAGIRPDERAPGYRHVLIDPQVPQGVTWVKASKETPYGTVRVDWKLDGGRFSAEVAVPANSTATFFLPAAASGCEVDGRAVQASDGKVLLASGRHTVAYLRGNESENL